MELTRYRCIKEVQAAKIKRIDGDVLTLDVDGRSVDVGVGMGFMTKHNPLPGQYYVQYGNISYCVPGEVLEGPEYTRI